MSAIRALQVNGGGFLASASIGDATSALGLKPFCPAQASIAVPSAVNCFYGNRPLLAPVCGFSLLTFLPTVNFFSGKCPFSSRTVQTC